MQSWKDFKKELLNNPKFKKEYERLQPEYAVISAMLEARIRKGLTQKELADRIGTKQSVISRLESGRANPSVAFLKKFAQALDTTLQIKFTRSFSP